jgi:dihydrodipicolinate synthase/N-acetylneuraminate lyase
LTIKNFSVTVGVLTSVPFRGVFAIPPTPFTPSGLVDEDSLRQCVDFTIRGGAHGVVGPVNASEFSVLMDHERFRVAEILVEQTAGRVPVVLGVSAASNEAAMRFARHAADLQADAVMAMPPYVRHPSADGVVDFYRQLAAMASPLPVWIQHYIPPQGMTMAPGRIAQILREIDGVDYVKEESLNALHVMTALRELAGPALKGMMGGMAGRYMIEEFRRGACGTMPACEAVDVHVQVWNALDLGDEATARELHCRLLPLLTYEAMYSFTVYKEVLVRRGVIASAATRMPGVAALDRENRYELDRLLSDLEPLFQLAPASASA